MQRSLARRIVQAEACEGGEGCRLAYEHLRGMLASKRIHPRDKGCMRALFCGGIWTSRERAACGYTDSERCEMCGDADSARRRLWLCTHPEVTLARQAALEDPGVCSRARNAPVNDTLYARGWALYRPNRHAPPASGGGITRNTWDAHGTPIDHQTIEAYEDACDNADATFVDGSCNPGLLPELSRAAWAVVHMKDGRTNGVVSALAWWPLPQTSQCAAWCAMGVVTEMRCSASTIYSNGAAIVSG